MIHFELNRGWQFYYKYVALVIVTAKKVIEKICKVIKLDFSSAENEEINVSFKNNILRDVYIKTKRFKFDLLFTLSIALSDLGKKTVWNYSTLHKWWQITTYRFISKSLAVHGLKLL